MVKDDPFGLSEDRGRTRVRPMAAPGHAARPVPPPPPGTPIERLRHHGNPLVNAFAPLLEFAPELERASPPDNPEVLRTRLLGELTAARDAAAMAGVPIGTADAAQWAVAALLDDLALNTPWGGASAWPRQPLVVMLRGDVDAGAQFFARLEEMERHPAREKQLLELYYLCLSLGFRGKYRVPGRAGDRSLMAVRAGAARFLRDQDAETAPLSPRWEGLVVADEKPRFAVPIWVLPIVALVVSTLVYVGLSSRLAVEAETLTTMVRALPPADRAEIYRPIRHEPPAEAPPVEPFQFDLLPEFEANVPPGLLPAMKGRETVNLATLVVQWTNPELFQPARAELTDGFEPLFVSIARVINENVDLIGSVRVVGHTDSVPLQPSNPLATNQRLSEARAESVARILVANGVPFDRVVAEGRAATQPVAGNDTREGRAANRRIELLIEKRL